MKKKLLLLVSLTALFICLFALTVGAVTGSSSNEFGTVTYVDGMSEVKGYDTTSRAVVQNADGTYTTYPAYYVYNGSTGTNMRVNLDKLATATGEGYTKASLIRIEVFADARLDWTFQSCTGLVEAILPEGVYLHYASFTGCSSLEEINLPSSVTQIPAAAFSGCKKLSSIEIPNSVRSVGDNAFEGCYMLSEIKFPEGYTGSVPQNLRKISSWSEPRVKVTYIVPKNCKGIGNVFAFNNCDVEKIIFTGNQSSAFIADVTSKASDWVSKITYENHCLHYYNNTHTFGAETLGFVGTKYQSDCVYTATCQNCSLNTVTRTVCGPMVKDLGYSAAYYDNSFTFDIIVNKENIKLYEKETGLKMSYGFIVGEHQEGDNGDILGVDNKAKIAKAIVANFAETQYEILNKYNLKMTGITEAQSTKLIYCCGFVNDGNKVDYLGATTDDGYSLAFSFATLPEKKETEI